MLLHLCVKLPPYRETSRTSLSLESKLETSNWFSKVLLLQLIMIPRILMRMISIMIPRMILKAMGSLILPNWLLQSSNLSIKTTMDQSTRKNSPPFSILTTTQDSTSQKPGNSSQESSTTTMTTKLTFLNSLNSSSWPTPLPVSSPTLPGKVLTPKTDKSSSMLSKAYSLEFSVMMSKKTK